METIRNYLENMFLHLPVTPEVLRAKAELAQMMEDKYNELRAEGRSDNEAVGVVISEYGNLNELAEALGIDDTVRVQAQEMNVRTEDAITVTIETARNYITAQAKKATFIAAGVGCFITCLVPLMLSQAKMEAMHAGDTYGDGGTSMIGAMALMFLFIGIGVGLCVYGSLRCAEWKDLERGPINMDFGTVEFIKNERRAFHPIYALFLTLGVILCATGIIPTIVGGIMTDAEGATDAPAILGFAITLIVVAIGVILIIIGNIRKSSYDKLLLFGGKSIASLSGDDDDLRDLTPTGKRVMSVYWPTVTCIYLIWSFLTFDWHITWIIWPVAGAMSKALHAVFVREDAL